MKLTDYYKASHLPASKSMYRMDCVASTGDYEPFESIARRSRDNRFFFYYGRTPEQFSIDAMVKGEMVITNKKNISTVCTDFDHPLCGYGDVKDTNDALLFLFSDDYNTVEIFVARGLKNQKWNLFALFVSGMLDDEMQQLRRQAKPTNIN